MTQKILIGLIATIAAIFSGAAVAQTDTAFTYQGELNENGSPATGDYNLEFSLWDAEFGGTVISGISLGVPVVEGKFTAEIDFGGAAFDNTARWLQIEVNGVPLSPRNPITRAPYAIQTRGIVVDELGNVGIGTSTTSGAKLDIVSHTSDTAVQAISTTGDLVSYGMQAKTTAENGTGIYGEANSGVLAYGIWGASVEGVAGYFEGDVDITGRLYKSAGSFKIDHPLDPENKYLSHSFVESPDMMNVYNGNIVTDGDGYATVVLPEWFEVLNREFRYQLTVIADGTNSDFVQAMIVERINDNRFKIRSSAPDTEVSWQITGVRQDPYAEANRIQVEQMKPTELRGFYRHPELYGRASEFREEAVKLRAMPRERLDSTGALHQ